MTPDELIAWRKKNRLPQTKTARILGCPRHGIRNWETGKNPVPKTIALAIAAVQFGLPPYGSDTGDPTA